jgi:hypothetical protein
MKKVQDLTGDELLDELGIEIEEEEVGGYTARQERIIAGFEDILRFYKEHGRPPAHSRDGDIFERIYAVRLDQLRKLPPEDVALLLPMDPDGLLDGTAVTKNATEIDDDDLLFASAQLQLHLPDRFGIRVEPREWFVVPLTVINEVMERIQDESITEFVYDSAAAKLRRIDQARELGLA